MKKVIAVSVFSFIVGFGSIALSCVGTGCFVSGEGYIDLDSYSKGGGKSYEFDTTNGGFTAGGGRSFGESKSWLDGKVKNGGLDGNIETYGGGFSETKTWKDADLIGSGSSNFATAGGSIDAKLNVGFGGKGSFVGGMYGSATQKTFNNSGMKSLKGWESAGDTGGFATQKSNGFFSGGVFGGADGLLCGKDTYINAGVSAGIEMTGSSFSQSQRFSSVGANGMKTEGLRNDVGANTSVKTFAKNNLSMGGYAAGGAAWLGKSCFYASGNVKSATAQKSQNGFASAGANGGYSGSGSFGNDYVGSALGYTMTTMTTLPGKGSISYSASGMKVTSFNGKKLVK